MERNYRMKIYMVSLLHRATINNGHLAMNQKTQLVTSSMRYGDGAGNTVEENSSIFSLI